jgi:hypothetical protein
MTKPLLKVLSGVFTDIAAAWLALVIVTPTILNQSEILLISYLFRYITFYIVFVIIAVKLEEELQEF